MGRHWLAQIQRGRDLTGLAAAPARLVRQRFSLILLACGLGLGPNVALAAPVQGQSQKELVPGLASIPTTQCQTEAPQPPTMRLEGRAEVAVSGDPLIEAWLASQAYRFGAWHLSVGQLPYAAMRFRESSDRFMGAIGPSKFAGEAMFAEAQVRRLMGQLDESARLFQGAVEQLKEHDPKSPYIAAGIQYLKYLPPLPRKKQSAKMAPLSKPLQGSVATYGHRPLVQQAGIVDRNVPLTGQVTQLEGGVETNTLKEGVVFGGAKQIAGIAPVDVSDDFVKKSLYKAFLKMTCLETAALGANYTTVANNYKSFRVGDMNVAAGGSDDLGAPVIRLKLKGQDYGISMALPGMAGNSKNVMVVTDGTNILAVDPRTYDTWKLIINWKGKKPEFDWWRLRHVKNGIW